MCCKESAPSPKRAIFLFFSLVGAALLRLDFMRAGNFVIDADEAIVGLMAKHILEGRGIPAFYYGQHYMGSLEALCASLSFYLFGISSLTLQLVPLLFSLGLILVVYRLSCEVAGERAGIVAALLCSFPPAPLVIWSFKARGGFIELLFIGALALLFTVRWLRKPLQNYRDFALLGLLLGVGWWVNNQILYFMVPVALFVGLRLVEALRAGEISLPLCAITSFAGACAFSVGSLPYLWYNWANGWPSLGMFQFAKPEQVLMFTSGLFSTALPILLGAKEFWHSDPAIGVSTEFAYAVYGFVLLSVVILRRRNLAALLRGVVDTREPLELFLAFLLCSCGVFVVSSFGWLSQAPRYLLPLYVGIFVVVGYWYNEAVKRLPRVSIIPILAILGLNISSLYGNGRSLPGEPVVYAGERVSRSHEEVISVLRGLNIKLIRTNYWIGYRLAFETGEDVTFRVLQEPRQVRIAKYQELPQGVLEDEIPLLLVPAERGLFVDGLTYLGYSFKEARGSGYVLLYDIKRPARSFSEVPKSELLGARGTGPQDALSAVDGIIDTRWGTGEHQQPGQSWSVSFRKPQTLLGVRYSLGAWRQDYPRSLSIEVEGVEGERYVVVSEREYAKIALLLLGGDITIFWSPIPASRVIFTQRANHPILDWSIAEVSFLKPVGTE